MNLEYNESMAAIDFPNSPNIGDEFSTATTVYIWTGTFWQVKQSTIAASSFAITNPLMNGTAAVGTSVLASRSDHVHPVDTSRAPLNSPSFTGTVSFAGATVTGIDLLPSQSGNSGKYLTTDGATASWATVDALPTQSGNSGKYLTTNGTTASWATLDLSLYAPLASPSLTGTPLSTTASVDTETTQIATTAFVINQAGSSNPLMNGTVAVGTSKRFSRQDHVHPVDTSREPAISAGTTSQYLRGDKTWQTLDKNAVGLGNVENTALSLWAGSSNITTLGTVTNLISPTAPGTGGVRKTTISTSAATGGADGDVWLVYV